jgi:hypothetical protein
MDIIGWLRHVTFGVVGIAGVFASLFITGIIGVQLMGISVFSDIIFLPIFGLKLYRLAPEILHI